ncbi:MAG: hypothetical protein JWO31_951 [Phycisphaerales bacterium]|nr:hypothetical protein [Phycisphaerales bacterium]
MPTARRVFAALLIVPFLQAGCATAPPPQMLVERRIPATTQAVYGLPQAGTYALVRSHDGQRRTLFWCRETSQIYERIGFRVGPDDHGYAFFGDKQVPLEEAGNYAWQFTPASEAERAAADAGEKFGYVLAAVAFVPFYPIYFLVMLVDPIRC